MAQSESCGEEMERDLNGYEIYGNRQGWERTEKKIERNLGRKWHKTVAGDQGF